MWWIIPKWRGILSEKQQCLFYLFFGASILLIFLGKTTPQTTTIVKTPNNIIPLQASLKKAKSLGLSA